MRWRHDGTLLSGFWYFHVLWIKSKLRAITRQWNDVISSTTPAQHQHNIVSNLCQPQNGILTWSRRTSCFIWTFSILNPLTAGAEYIFLVPPFKHVRDQMWHESELKIASLPLFCEICIIFTHLKLWIALARHNFKWVKILIELFGG